VIEIQTEMHLLNDYKVKRSGYPSGYPLMTQQNS